MPQNKKPCYNVMLSGGRFYKRFDSLDDAYACADAFPGYASIEKHYWIGDTPYIAVVRR